jgi:hypothetical protein
VKYDIYSGRFSAVFEEFDQHFRILDVLGDNYLTPGLPDERHWFMSYNGDPGIWGVLPLLLRDISGKSTRKVLTPLHPDSTYKFSVIMNAGFISKEEVVFHKLIMKKKDEVEIMIQVVNLGSGEIRTLSTKTVDVGHGRWPLDGAYDISGFTVSPDGKWVAYSSREKGIVFLSINDGKSFELAVPKAFLKKTFEGGYNKHNCIEILDWSPDGSKILCKMEIGIETWFDSDGTKKEKDKLYLLDVPDVVNSDK